MRHALIRTAGLWILLIPGVIALQPVFGGWQGVVPGLAGITLGCVLGWVAAQRRFSLVLTILTVLGAYLLVGGAVALPKTTIAGFIPTVETLQRLVLLMVQGWADLLTVATPAADFTGPAAIPWMTGLASGAGAASFACRSRAVLTPVLLPLATLVFGIVFGTRTAPTAAWLGVALGVGMLVWGWAHAAAEQRASNAGILVDDDPATTGFLRQAVAAVTLLGVGATVAIVTTVATGVDAKRQVLRDEIAPPLDLKNYPSPLTRYRKYELDLKDETLFTVRGLPERARLRVAAMDTYDGTVFDVSPHANHYLRSGRNLSPEAANASMQVSVEGYADVWVPHAGQPRRLEFVGDRRAVVSDGVYYNKTTKQMLTTAGLNRGDSYRLEADITPVPSPQERDKLGARQPGHVPPGKLQRVPEVLVSFASETVHGADNSYAQLVALERKLRQGYYSDQKSRSGHTAERLNAMFRGRALIGDDEQYATAMAIMANELGVPARVVLGFYPKHHPRGHWEVKGAEAHVWVEANFAETGWIVFDPTPDRDRTPKAEAPKPKPKPKPQIDPPPNPPEKAPDDPVLKDPEAVREERDEGGAWLAVLMVVGATASGLLLVFLPFLVVLGLKLRRRSRRMAEEALHNRIAGAWDELVDRVRDMGYQASRSETRRATAAELQRRYPEVPVAAIAQDIDAALFGPVTLTQGRAQGVWMRVIELNRQLIHRLPRRRRIAVLVSLRSFRRAPLARDRAVPDLVGGDDV